MSSFDCPGCGRRGSVVHLDEGTFTVECEELEGCTHDEQWDVASDEPDHTEGIAWLDASLEAVNTSWRKEVDRIADEAKKNVIVPFCDRHKLYFLSGMGTYSFHFLEDEKKPANERRRIGGYTGFAAEDLESFGIDAQQIVEILDASTGPAGQGGLYNYMSDYNRPKRANAS